MIIKTKEYYTDFSGNTRYVSGKTYRGLVQDYPDLRSSHGYNAYIGKYVEVDNVGDNPWGKQLVITAYGIMRGMGLREPGS